MIICKLSKSSCLGWRELYNGKTQDLMKSICLMYHFSMKNNVMWMLQQNIKTLVLGQSMGKLENISNIQNKLVLMLTNFKVPFLSKIIYLFAIKHKNETGLYKIVKLLSLTQRKKITLINKRDLWLCSYIWQSSFTQTPSPKIINRGPDPTCSKVNDSSGVNSRAEQNACWTCRWDYYFV